MKNLVVAVDIGKINTAYALVDEFGKIYASDEFQTSDYAEFEDFILKIRDGIKDLSFSLDEPHTVDAIGIGAPNGNYYTGEIENAPNLSWQGKLPIVKQLNILFNNIPIIVTNNANAAAIGELMYGGGKDMKNFSMIKLDTGLGSGVIVNGNIMYGHDGHAGELGHTTIRSNGRECGCGKRGCLERYASSTGLKLNLIELLAASPENDSHLKEIPFNKLDTTEIIEAAKKGDEIAKKAIELTANYLGAGIADLVAITAPEAVFIYGSLSKAQDLILKPIIKSFEENVMPIWRDKVQISISSLYAESAPILGAAALAIQELRKRSKVVAKRRVV